MIIRALKKLGACEEEILRIRNSGSLELALADTSTTSLIWLGDHLKHPISIRYKAEYIKLKRQIMEAARKVGIPAYMATISKKPAMAEARRQYGEAMDKLFFQEIQELRAVSLNEWIRYLEGIL
jgi:hypothetical protein